MSQVALGMILFSVGSALDLSHFRHMGRRIVTITGIEAALTGCLVTTSMLALDLSWMVALLLVHRDVNGPCGHHDGPSRAQ